MSRNPAPRHTRTYEARQIEEGAVRLPGGLLPPEAAQALELLLEVDYERSKVAVIAKALIEARERRVSE